ncbi:MAG: glucosaminidase domain-containing protein, partial [Gammaproteobacteria bacterium]|nr:glucosaminidase domain-containing protein [Gammaproteobacteria bacterium]
SHDVPERPSGAYPLPASPLASAAPRPLWSDAESFARDIWPHAERAAERLNVSPEAIVAQAALETGWGEHVPHAEDGSSSLNLFGIKASGGWAGERVTKPTLEFEDGLPRPQLAEFRAYNDVAATFDDYSAMLTQNPRYSTVSDHGDDIEGFARALQSSGYATDPAYAQKLKAVADSDIMKKAISGLKNSAASPIPMRQLSDAI